MTENNTQIFDFLKKDCLTPPNNSSQFSFLVFMHWLEFLKLSKILKLVNFVIVTFLILQLTLYFFLIQIINKL